MRCAVLGQPVAHSLSPVLHRAAYAHLGLDWRFDAVEVDEAGLPGFLSSLGPTWRGLALTMPLKRAVLPLLDEVSEVAARVRAANTVLLVPGSGRAVRIGDNTDVPGAVAALREAGVAAVTSVLLIGGGATAASIVAAVGDLGAASVTVALRTPARAATVRTLATALGMPVDVVDLAAASEVSGVDLVVSTTPAGATDALAEQVAGGRCRWGAPVLFDVVYSPWPTPLARAWRTQGGQVLGGLDLLVHQAVGQVALMTGRAVPVGVLRDAGAAVLVARGAGHDG